MCICTIIGVGERERDWVLPGEHHNHSIQVNRTVCNSFQHKLLICKKVSMQELEVYQKRKSRRHEHKWENTCWLCKVKDYNHTRISEMSDSIQKGIFFFFFTTIFAQDQRRISHAHYHKIARSGFVQAWYKLHSADKVPAFWCWKTDQHHFQ